MSTRAMSKLKLFLAALMAVCVVVIGLVSFHSAKEIDRLKSFYPAPLTVEEAFYASLVEFIKVHVISLPLMAVILLAAFFLWLNWRKPPAA
jgi:hypothetical protein